MKQDLIDEALLWIARNSREPAVNCRDLKAKLGAAIGADGPEVDGQGLPKDMAPVAFFTPWGPKYTYKEKGTEVGGPERLTLGELAGISGYFNSELGIPAKWYIMFADIYGTQINGLPESAVNSYFSNLEREIAGMPGFRTMWWSRVKDCGRYRELNAEVCGRFSDYVAPEILRKNIEKSRELGGDETNARAYSAERVVEGLLIEELYSPVKFSLVASKNDVLDGPLRRVYVVENRKPWLK